jgi:hypothetical protein
MSRDERLDDLISAWLLAEAPREVPDRVLHETFERTRRTRQQVGWRARLRRLQMPGSNVARISMVMGATAIAAILGYNAWTGPLAGPGEGGATPSPSATATPASTTPSPKATTPATTTWTVPHPFFVELSIDVPSGWSRQDAGPDMAGTNRRSWSSVLIVTSRVAFHADPCQRRGSPELQTFEAATGSANPTRHDLMNALASLSVEMAPVEVTEVSGYPAYATTLSAPADGRCADGEYLMWRWPNGYDHGVGAIGETRVVGVDVEGTLVMIVLEDRGTPEESAELDEVFRSIRLAPAPTPGS